MNMEFFLLLNQILRYAALYKNYFIFRSLMKIWILNSERKKKDWLISIKIIFHKFIFVIFIVFLSETGKPPCDLSEVYSVLQFTM